MLVQWREPRSTCDIEEGATRIVKMEGLVNKLQVRWKEIDKKRYKKGPKNLFSVEVIRPNAI